jgi:PAS domain S-box-containing protein
VSPLRFCVSRPYTRWGASVLLHAAFDRETDGIPVHAQGEIVFANAASARLLKVDSADALVGTSYEGYLQPDSIDEVRQRVLRTYAGEVVGAQEARMIRPDGSALDVEISRSRVLFEGRLAVQSVIRELTERKREARAARS